MSSGAASSGTTAHQAAAHTGHSPQEIRAHVKVYMMVFGALAVLTVVTVAARYLNVPVHLAIGLALLIATVKASLVALFFMHLKGEVRTIVWTLMLTAVFFIVLVTIPLSWYLDGPKHPAGKAATSHQSTAHGTTTH
jgi:cytochrome c oxidase subunit 4